MLSGKSAGSITACLEPERTTAAANERHRGIAAKTSIWLLARISRVWDVGASAEVATMRPKFFLFVVLVLCAGSLAAQAPPLPSDTAAKSVLVFVSVRASPRLKTAVFRVRGQPSP
jgi:hypothetical protein